MNQQPATSNQQPATSNQQPATIRPVTNPDHEGYRPWYYRTELTPGVFSDGRPRANLKLTLHLLSKTSVAGQSCLDIGTQEAAVPTMLRKAGAAGCVAYDRVDLQDRIQQVQQAHGVHFDYHGGHPFDAFAREVRHNPAFPFDVVVNSGVIYHLFDPLRGLAFTRGLVRTGGILVVETAVVPTEDFAMHFNVNGRFFPASHYFQISLPLFDYLLRYMRLKPIDLVYNATNELKDDFRLLRMAVACRAMDEPVAAPEDAWMVSSNRIGHDFKECLDWRLLRTNRAEVPYEGANPDLVRRADGSVDLAASQARVPGVKPELFTFTLDANLPAWREAK